MLLRMPKISLIIPCYNEEKRLNANLFLDFAKSQNDVNLIFVNDGSTDKTIDILEKLYSDCPSKIKIISHCKNKGKAEAVRTGFLSSITQKNVEFIAYLDADLSTPLEEFLRLAEVGYSLKSDYFFASRIKMLNHEINRSFFRHLAGRAITTIINTKYHLKIYDTQCGAKFFKSEIANAVFLNEFKTKWLFDIEIFLRIYNTLPLSKGTEIPLQKWADSGKSKLTIFSFPEICKELLMIMNYGK
jgi:dolichyl-phosphate beta-glucosyltransferase